LLSFRRFGTGGGKRQEIFFPKAETKGGLPKKAAAGAVTGGFDLETAVLAEGEFSGWEARKKKKKKKKREQKHRRPTNARKKSFVGVKKTSVSAPQSKSRRDSCEKRLGKKTTPQKKPSRGKDRRGETPSEKRAWAEKKSTRKGDHPREWKKEKFSS